MATSVFHEDKHMKDNVGFCGDSESEKQALVWDYIVKQAMEKETLEMWECLKLELNPWEMLITSADTVHFESEKLNTLAVHF